MPASQKFSHLLQLADQGPALRAALAEEVAELLISWPSDYPENMRGVCEALLAKTARDVDADTRTRLRRLLHSNPELSRRVLPRDPASQALIEAARSGENLPAALAQSLGVDGNTALQILHDETGVTLAAACKGAGFDRATFSALALLAYPGRDRGQAFAVLDTFDTIAMSEATQMPRADQAIVAA